MLVLHTPLLSPSGFYYCPCFTNVETEARRSKVLCLRSHREFWYRPSCCNRKTPKLSKLNISLLCMSGVEPSMSGGWLCHPPPQLPSLGAGQAVPKGDISQLAGREAGHPAPLPLQHLPSHPSLMFCLDDPSSLPIEPHLQVCSLLAYSHVTSPA